MFFALASAAVAFGAAVDGKWTVETQGRNGTQTLTLTLQSDGSNLTGSSAGGRGGSAEITEGKMDGANVSFSVCAYRNAWALGRSLQRYCYRATI